MEYLAWRLKTKAYNAVHLYTLGEDKTLCGKPQENYDTEEVIVTLTEFKKYNNACCKNCLKKATKLSQKGLDLN
jgi:hypothetical protein